MKTESTKKEQSNANIQSAVSSAAGAVVGTAAVLSADSIYAAVEGALEMEPLTTPMDAVNQSEVEVVAAPLSPQESNPTQEPVVEVAQEQDMEIIEVTLADTSYYFADVDMDGAADAVAVDLNSDGQIDKDEIFDITQEGVMMSEVSELAQLNSTHQTQSNDNSFDNHLAYDDSGDMPDYTNNADVNEYMA